MNFVQKNYKKIKIKILNKLKIKESIMIWLKKYFLLKFRSQIHSCLDSTYPQIILKYLSLNLYIIDNLLNYSTPMTFRSEQMKHYQLIIPRQIAWEVTDYLGYISRIHIEDISNPLDRPFYHQIKRCEESLQKVNTLISFLKQKKVEFEKYDPVEIPQFVENLLLSWRKQFSNLNTSQIKRLDRIEDQINREWGTFEEITHRIDKLNNTLNVVRGKMAVYSAANIVLGNNYFSADTSTGESKIVNYQIQQKLRAISGLSYIVGVIKQEQEARIQKMIFRVSRGYACASIIRIADLRKAVPELQNFQQNVIFVFFPSSEKNTLQKKLQRVVQSFCTSVAILPSSKPQFQKQNYKLQSQYRESLELQNLLQKQLYTFMDRIKNIKFIEEWRIFLTKEKLLYDSINKMQVRDQFLTARFYIPAEDFNLLENIVKMSPTPIFNELKLRDPPSKFQMNDFIGPGQQIVQTYGIPRYGQINPGIFTCITFPFFFGVMFGDIGHGFVLFCLGLFLVLGNDILKNTPFRAILNLRYMVLLMGFFALYCGFIYNDFIGVSLNIFGSCYNPGTTGGSNTNVVRTNEDCVYIFGLDPIWGISSNELLFVNSLKMKLAVILGIIHMIFGIFLKASNALYFKKKLDFFFQFLPQIVFMVLIFGYMDFIIIFKWLIPWPHQTPITAASSLISYSPPLNHLQNFSNMPDMANITSIPNLSSPIISSTYNISLAPSIITIMINIPLKLGKTVEPKTGGGPLWGEFPNSSQDKIQLFILLIGVLCIPLMLCPKPIVQIKHYNKRRAEKNMIEQQQKQRLIEKEDEEPIPQNGEVIVHQIIETIEFVLNSISNTASYLRLWALSLAHSQLSKVFFEKTVQNGFTSSSIVGSLIFFIAGYYILTWVTFGVLMCMDTMECFLHSLRLHWVEFQNKFYKADGRKFEPLSFHERVIEMKTMSESQ